MGKIFEIASQIKTPLGLAGIIFIAAFFIVRSMLQRKALPGLTRTLSEKTVRLIIWLLFTLGALALVFAFLGYVIGSSVSNDSLDYTGRVTDAVTHRTIRNATVSVEEDQRVPQIQSTDEQGIFHVTLRSSTNSVRIRVEANGYEVLDRRVTITRTGVEDVGLTPVGIAVSSVPTPISGGNAGNPNVKVWVNTDTGVYHCPGSYWYDKKTKKGQYMAQKEAQDKHYRPASDKVCH